MGKVEKLTKAIEDALGDTLDGIGDKPFDPSHAYGEGLIVRVVVESWVGFEHLMASGEPLIGRESIKILVRGQWLYWGYDSVREEIRKIIRVVEGQGWQFQSVNHGEDDDFVDSMLDFTELEVAPY